MLTCLSDASMRTVEVVRLPWISETGVSFEVESRIFLLPHGLILWTQDNFCTFDIIGKFAFSSDFGCLESSRYHPWVRLVVFQQREIEWITEMKRQGLTLLVAAIKKVFAKHKQEFLGYTEYVLDHLMHNTVLSEKTLIWETGKSLLSEFDWAANQT